MVVVNAHVVGWCQWSVVMVHVREGVVVCACHDHLDRGVLEQWTRRVIYAREGEELAGGR